MPDITPFTNATRATADLHAEWWNPAYTLNGVPGHPQLDDDEPGGRFVERAVIYAEMYGADTQSMKANQLQGVDLTQVGSAKSAAALARDRVHKLKRMVVEITNSRGEVIADKGMHPLTEATLAGMHERDIAFIERAIDDLAKAPAVPVLPEHEAKAQQEYDDYASRIERGAPEGGRTPRTAEVVAMDDFRGSGQ